MIEELAFLFQGETKFTYVLIALAVVLVGFFVYRMVTKEGFTIFEGLDESAEAEEPEAEEAEEEEVNGVEDSNAGSPIEDEEQVDASDDDVKPDELLPSDDEPLKGKNFLESGHHVGVNTVGQSLRNANYDLRSAPANPRDSVSPWLNSTIEPDTNRKVFEIGECK